MNETEKKPTVSIVIPAYNQPEYLRRLLQSIVEQEYRPIEVIVSDDCSPTPLEPVVNEFREWERNDFIIRFHRQAVNQGVMGNFTFAVERATGKYVVPFAHDNWFIDRKFLAEAIKILEADSRCHVCLANAIYEDTGKPLLSNLNVIGAEADWVTLRGDEFIPLWSYYPGQVIIGSTQVCVVDNELAQTIGAFREPFIVNEELAHKLGLAADTCTSFVFTLSSIGNVAVTGKVVCIVGTPANSYSKTEKWRRASAAVNFIVLYNIYRAGLKGKYADAVKREARKRAVYKLEAVGVNLKIIRHFENNPQVFIWMCWANISLLQRVLYSASWRGFDAFKGYIRKVIGEHYWESIKVMHARLSAGEDSVPVRTTVSRNK